MRVIAIGGAAALIFALCACSSTTSSGGDAAAGGGDLAPGGSSGSSAAGGSAGLTGGAANGGSSAGFAGEGTSGAPSAGGTPGGGGAAGGGGAPSAAGAGGMAGLGNGGTNGGSAGSSGVAGSAAAGASGGSNSLQVDVYLIAGQSNATGQGYMKNLPSGFMVDTRVQLYHSADIKSGAAANTWIPLRHASEMADACGERFGPELGFGNNIQSLYPTRPIAIIKHAKSATNLVSEWAPGSSPTDTAHFGLEFKTFAATVDGGLKALRAAGKQPVIRAMLWQQGEADADLGGTASSDYGKHLTALIARVRDQWSAPNMLFVYGFVYPVAMTAPGRDDVRTAEKNVDQDSGNALATKGAFVVDTDGLELRANDPNSCYKSDVIHYGTAGQLELGKRLATKVHDKLQLAP